MEVDHPTTVPEQSKTDQFTVFADTSPNLELVARVQVPRYSQPNADGTELSFDKRLSLAVARAVEKKHTVVPDGIRHHQQAFEGQQFMVMHDMDKPMELVEFEENTSFDGVWDPEGDSQ